MGGILGSRQSNLKAMFWGRGCPALSQILHGDLSGPGLPLPPNPHYFGGSSWDHCLGVSCRGARGMETCREEVLATLVLGAGDCQLVGRCWVVGCGACQVLMLHTHTLSGQAALKFWLELGVAGIQMEGVEQLNVSDWLVCVLGVRVVGWEVIWGGDCITGLFLLQDSQLLGEWKNLTSQYSSDGNARWVPSPHQMVLTLL